MTDPYVSGLVHPKVPIARQQKVVKTQATTNPEPLTLEQQYYQSLSLSGVKASPSTPNTGAVFVGFDSTDLPISISAGATLSITSGRDGWPNDLSKIWIKGAVGDGVVALFQSGVEQ